MLSLFFPSPSLLLLLLLLDAVKYCDPRIWCWKNLFIRLAMKLKLIKFKSSYNVNISCCVWDCHFMVFWRFKSYDEYSPSTILTHTRWWSWCISFNFGCLSCSSLTLSRNDTQPAHQKYVRYQNESWLSVSVDELFSNSIQTQTPTIEPISNTHSVVSDRLWITAAA